MSCETACVSECCGLEAFDFSEEGFRAWLKGRTPHDGATAVEQLEALLARIAAQTEDLVSSDELNHEWAKARALDFFSALHRRLKGVL